MLKKRGQVYHLSKRVPKRYADVESRTVIDLSLRTSSLTTAAQKAEETWNNLLQSWEYKLAGDAMSAEQRYRNALQTAQRMGFDYVPAQDIPKMSTDEILDRVEASVDEDVEDAVLGLVPEVEIMISECLDVFLDCYPEKIHGKSSDQLRRYKEPRTKVIADFIKISGDKPISKITRADMLGYRSWLAKKVTDGLVEPSTSNKDLTYFCGMLRGINKHYAFGLFLPFDDLKMKEGRGNTRGTFSKHWIQDRLLAAGALDGMGQEERNIFLIMINTGARPSEIAGIKVKHLRLDENIPLMEIKPEGRQLKNENSERSVPLAGVSLAAARDALRAAILAGRKEDDWVFPQYAGLDKLSGAINKFMRENELKENKNTTLYSLRHSFEDRLIEAGVDERVRRDLFGHALNSERYGTGGGDEIRYQAVKVAAL
jgi:integrase